MKKNNYWDTKSLTQMTHKEWESLCDHCGLCCLVKLQDEDTGEVVYTSVVCRYSSVTDCSCTDYANRSINEPECVPFPIDRVEEFEWLPDSCAYRLLYKGEKLKSWHPLNSGTPLSVKKAGVGIQSFPIVIDKDKIDYEDFIIEKPSSL